MEHELINNVTMDILLITGTLTDYLIAFDLKEFKKKDEVLK